MLQITRVGLTIFAVCSCLYLHAGKIQNERRANVSGCGNKKIVRSSIRSVNGAGDITICDTSHVGTVSGSGDVEVSGKSQVASIFGSGDIKASGASHIGRVSATGDVKGTDSHIGTITGSGNKKLDNCTTEDARGTGSLTCSHSRVQTCDITGHLQCSNCTGGLTYTVYGSHVDVRSSEVDRIVWDLRNSYTWCSGSMSNTYNNSTINNNVIIGVNNKVHNNNSVVNVNNGGSGFCWWVLGGAIFGRLLSNSLGERGNNMYCMAAGGAIFGCIRCLGVSRILGGIGSFFGVGKPQKGTMYLYNNRINTVDIYKREDQDASVRIMSPQDYVAVNFLKGRGAVTTNEPERVCVNNGYVARSSFS